MNSGRKDGAGGDARAEARVVFAAVKSAPVNGEPGLEEVSLSLPAGEICVAFGREGAGPSELLRLAVGVTRPVGGSVRLLGVDLAGAGGSELQRLRSRVGYVFRGTGLMSNLSLAENVELPLRYHTALDAHEAARRVDELVGLVGLGAVCGRRPADVDLLARKRAAFARALTLNPEVLLADYPLEGLDPIAAARLAELLLQAARSPGRACLIATCDVDSYREVGDRFVMMEGGRVIWTGGAGELATTDQPVVRQFLDHSVKGPLAAF